MINKNDIYTDNFEGELGSKLVDFLPSPEQLVRKPKMQRVTMEIPLETVCFFKEKAAEHGASYQLMIREVLSHYAQAHSGK